ncbi:ParB/RepB/Spo0J family partition protein [Arcobacter sp. 15-2]|uniref:ParB/RepB/Spo0J family partition protein n=1 Tax=Arcobacter sp. 15-2 TaxID=3374109 RepID=UPI00399CAF91
MALGRGLGELLGEIETAYENNNVTSKNEIFEIDVNNIKLNPYQPRKIFNEDKLKELSQSIKNNGLLQPIVVTKDAGTYLLVAGERRLRATKLAQIATIKAVVIDIDSNKLRELALIENIQRDDLNVIEVAYSYAGLINDYNITHEELSTIVSKSRSSISNILRLLTLSSFAQKMLGADKISLGHAKLIVGLTENEQKLVIDSIIGQKLSVRETETLVKQIKNVSQEDTKQTTKKSKYNFDVLTNIKETLTKNNLNVKIDDNYFKIKINSQEDIENISKAFSNK